MARLRNSEVKEAYAFCVERDTLKCNMLDTTCAGTLVLDHKDNNSENNPPDGSNWQLLCRSHNRRKNPGGPRRFSNKFASAMSLDYSHTFTRQRNREGIPITSMSAQMLKSQDAKKKILVWLKEAIESDPLHRYPVSEVVRSGSWIGDVKQKAVSEYLDSFTSQAAPFTTETIDGVEYIKFKTPTPGK